MKLAFFAACLLFMSAGLAHGQDDFDLGRAYRHGAGVPQDSARAFELVQAAARGGNPAAMFTLSNMLTDGEGVGRDEDRARQWLLAAVDRDYPEALQQLAFHLQEGTLGFERDERRAAQLLRAMAHALKHRAHGH